MEILEQKVLELFGHPEYCFSSVGCNCDHVDIPWQLVPISTPNMFIVKKTVYNKQNLEWYINESAAKMIDTLIKQADSSLCLTSSVEYIRECKKWQLERSSNLNMNLEQQINKLIEDYNADSLKDWQESGDDDGPAYEDYHQLMLIEDWIWVDEPQTGEPVHNPTNKLIEKTTTEVCLTSPSEYIREYKKWQLERSK